MIEELKKYIDDIIKNHDVVLFMKGSRDFPACGFSGRVVSIFENLGLNFKDVDIFSIEGLREGLKEYSDWPTFPQIYIKQEFMGGCDIISQMYENGELRKICEDYCLL